MYFNLSIEQLKQLDAYATASEINQQPSTWNKTKAQYDNNKQTYHQFVDAYINNPNATIIFAGAGSSEFVGNALIGSLKTKVAANMQSIATTDLLTDVSVCLNKHTPTLMVSFGRSGNSPESVGAFLEVQQYCEDVKHVFITCNNNGKLAKLVNEYDNILSIELTEETHDVGFAMTSSFTNMYLMALLLFDLSITQKHIDQLNGAVENFLSSGFKQVNDQLSSFDFNRIVYLGSHVFKGIAQEASLKLLELTGGECASLFDSFLGFRHGPKSFLDKNTLSVMFLSNIEHVRRYELDLLKEMSQESNKGKILVLDTKEDVLVKEYDHQLIALTECEHCPTSVVALGYLVVAQSLSLLKSLALNKTPDNPDPTGSVNRVVKGVTLYIEGDNV